MSTNVPLQSIVLTSDTSSVTFSGIPQTYTDLILIVNSTTSVSDRSMRMQFNGDTNTNYSYTNMVGYSGGAISQRLSNYASLAWGSSSDTSGSNTYTVNIQNYSNSTTYKNILSRGNTPGSNSSVDAHVGTWRNTTAITSFSVYPSSGNFNAGSTFDLYGIQSGAPSAFGGDIVTTDGNYWYHTFKTSGTFTLQYPKTVDYLVVAGGGGGGGTAADAAGGGGAGGLRCTVTATGGGGSLESALSLSPATYTVTVGAGGAGGPSDESTNGINGNDSSISGTGLTTITSTGGGGGGRGAGNSPGYAASNGGSGGGGGAYGQTGGTRVVGQGYAGGTGGTANYGSGAGGGGAGAAGSNGGGTGSSGGAGGVGVATSISGSSTYYAGGGGGGPSNNAGPAVGAGGNGGGGGGTTPNANGTAATANTGGGGGAAARNSGGGSRTGGAGGSGIVILRYAV